MKLYFEDISSINIDNISTYQFHKDIQNYIYSDEGIFKYTNDNIYRISEIYDDDNIKKININNNQFISDNSKIIKKEKWYQIPQNHKLETNTYHFYRLRPKALIQLVVEYINNNITHIYFTTDEDIHSKNINEDIDTFLSLLKIY
tara:strand:- start:2133 stop:2567 length:435 start_codon:yes stop_codon:yes gene_type:complete